MGRVQEEQIPPSHQAHTNYNQDQQEKQFLFRHSKMCFDLLDTDYSRSISTREFETFGFLFNFTKSSIITIFKEFDVSGDKVSGI